MVSESLKSAICSASRTAAFAAFVALLERLAPRRAGSLRVLTYHRVAPLDGPPDSDPALISAAPDEFERQMTSLARRYQPVEMQQVYDAVCGSACLPPRAVLITFDDAYRDFAEAAWPILRRLGVPVTLFVPTGYPDRPGREFWWDRLYRAIQRTTAPQVAVMNRRFPLRTRAERDVAHKVLVKSVKALPHEELEAAIEHVCRQLGAAPRPDGTDVLGWSALRQLAAEGVTLCPHTQTHPLLNRVSLERARAEASGSLADLEREIGPTLPVLAWPAGGCSPELTQALADDGFRLAFTTVPGSNRLDRCDPLRLRRIHVGPRTSLPLLRARLLA